MCVIITQFVHNIADTVFALISRHTGIVIIVIVLNLTSAVMYFADKRFAVRERQRISERALITAAFFGTSGALAAMSIFRHKTKKKSFRIKLFLAISLKILLIISAFLIWRQL